MAPTPDAAAVARQGSLRRSVETLAGQVGIRNAQHAGALTEAAHFIEAELTAAGLTRSPPTGSPPPT